jgi:excinuclease UvrABC helicase subunit UvrB
MVLSHKKPLAQLFENSQFFPENAVEYLYHYDTSLRFIFPSRIPIRKGPVINDEIEKLR